MVTIGAHSTGQPRFKSWCQVGDVGVASTPTQFECMESCEIGIFEDKKADGYVVHAVDGSNCPRYRPAYVNYTKSAGDRQGISASLRYFSLGEINFTNEQGNPMGTFNPYEFYFDVAYALKLSDHWERGNGIALIYSDIAQGQVVQGLQTNQVKVER